MEFNTYLNRIGDLYLQGVCSYFNPDLLRSFGGTLALAARDALNVRMQEDRHFGFCDRRPPPQLWDCAHSSWRAHRAGIIARVRDGASPAQGIYDYLSSHRIAPHRPCQVREALQRVRLNNGNQCSSWQHDATQFRERFRQGSGGLVNGANAATTMAAPNITAEDWANATPRAWQRALCIGEVSLLVGHLLNQHPPARQAWVDPRIEPRSAR